MASRKLTKRVVESIKAPDRDVIVWDTELLGFGVRVRPSGRRTYVLKYRVGGGRSGTARKPSIGIHGNITCDEARGIAKSWLAEVAKGGDPGGDRKARRQAATITELCEQYLRDYAEGHKRASSIAEDRRLIEQRLKPSLGQVRVPDLSRTEVNRFHQALRSTPYEANRSLALLSKMMNLAEVWGFRPDGSNPCRHVKRFPEKKRERFLTSAELARLGDTLAAVENLQTESIAAIAAIRLLILTGCRLSEILTLRWAFVDFENTCLQLPESKTGEKTVYLSAPALEVLNALGPGEPDTWVLPGLRTGTHFKSLHGPWRRICARSGLDNVRLHDLRHSFASVGAGAGLSLPMIGKMLGHTQAATTQRYAHLAADPVRQATEQVGATIAAAMSGSNAEVVELSRKRK